MRGLFVTGTGTDVGKTVAAACLVRALDADYWKPVQSGLSSANDAAEVERLTGLPPTRNHPFVYALQAPLSPHEAARLEGVVIEMDRFVLPVTTRPLVVEGAGGLLVPLNTQDLMIDLIVRLGLPVVLVGLSGLGTINHTLLSLEALRQRKVPVLGVILNGPANAANRAAIERHGRIPVRELPHVNRLDSASIAAMAGGLGNILKEPW